MVEERGTSVTKPRVLSAVLGDMDGTLVDTEPATEIVDRLLDGGCCGTTPAHIRAVAAAVAGLNRPERTVIREPSVSSLYTAVPFHQDASVLMIGERTNANGSKAFREAPGQVEGPTSSVGGSGARYIRSTPSSAAGTVSGSPRYTVTGVTLSGRLAVFGFLVNARMSLAPKSIR